MLIIPAIDVLDGRVVRLRRGVREEVTFYGDLEDTIKRYQDQGIDRLHIVDLNAAFGERTSLLSRLRSFEKMKFQVGGGLRSLEKIKSVLLDTDFDVVIGSYLTTGDESIKDRLSDLDTSRMIAALDVVPTKSFFCIKDNGWLRDTNKNILDVVSECSTLNFKSFLVTDISKDGEFSGPNLDLYELILKNFPGISLIASGGVRSLLDVQDLSLLQIQSVIVGKAIYENRITLSEVKQWQQ